MLLLENLLQLAWAFAHSSKLAVNFIHGKIINVVMCTIFPVGYHSIAMLCDWAVAIIIQEGALGTMSFWYMNNHSLEPGRLLFEYIHVHVYVVYVYVVCTVCSISGLLPGS